MLLRSCLIDLNFGDAMELTSEHCDLALSCWVLVATRLTFRRELYFAFKSSVFLLSVKFEFRTFTFLSANSLSLLVMSTVLKIVDDWGPLVLYLRALVAELKVFSAAPGAL